MRTLFLLVFFCAATAVGAQDRYLSVTGSEADIEKSLTEGHMTLQLHGVNEKEIMKSADIYADYFSYETTQSSGDVIRMKIKFEDETEISRRVVHRFAISLGLKSVRMDGEEITTEEFFERILD